MGKISDVYDIASLGSSIVTHATDVGGGGSSAAWAMAGLGRDFIGGADTLAQIGGNALGNAKFAAGLFPGTPIIAGGLKLLGYMNDTMGAGGPERGDRFQNGSDQFDKIHGSLADLDAPDSWQGDASQFYTTNNEVQTQRAQAIAESDKLIKGALDSEAAKIKETRDLLDRNSTILMAAIAPALAAKAIPVVGVAMSEAIELAAVAGTVPPAVNAMSYLISDALHAATLVRRAGAGYDRAQYG